MNQPLSAHLQELERRLGGRRLPLIIVIVLVIIIGLPSLFFPYGRDQGIHAYVAASWLDGQLPYRDVWVQKGILTYLPHLLTIAAFGRTAWAIRLLDLAWQIVISWLIYRIARRRLSNAGSMLAVVFYLLLYFAIGFWNTSHGEGFLLPFLLLAVDLYDRARLLPSSGRQRRLIFFCGLFVAITPWFKQTSLIFVAAIFLWVTADVLGDEKKSLRLWLERIIPFGAGVLTFSLIVTLFLLTQGMLTPMLKVLRYSISAYPNYGPLNEISDFGWVTYQWVRQKGLLVPLFIAGLVIILLRRDRRHSWLGLLILVSAGLIGVYAQRRLWEYHWVSIFPFMAIIAAGAAVVLVNQLFKPARSVQKWVIVALALVLVLALSKPLLSTHRGEYARLLRYFAGGRDAESYATEFGMGSEAKVADYLRQRSEPGDPLFIWGHYALLYYLTGGRNPTRFAMDPPLSLEHAQQDAWQAETILDLQADPPQYIVVATADITPFEPLPSKQQLANFPELANFIDDDYYQVETLAGFDIHVRKVLPEVEVGTALGTFSTLEGYDLHSLDIKPEGEVAATLHWRADGSPDTDYTVFVHLLDSATRQVVAQSDTYPAQGLRPTSAWQTGDLILDTHHFTLPADLPEGLYELIVGMYRLDTMERLPVSGNGLDYISLLGENYAP